MALHDKCAWAWCGHTNVQFINYYFIGNMIVIHMLLHFVLLHVFRLDSWHFYNDQALRCVGLVQEIFGPSHFTTFWVEWKKVGEKGGLKGGHSTTLLILLVTNELLSTINILLRIFSFFLIQSNNGKTKTTSCIRTNTLDHIVTIT